MKTSDEFWEVEDYEEDEEVNLLDMLIYFFEAFVEDDWEEDTEENDWEEDTEENDWEVDDYE